MKVLRTIRNYLCYCGIEKDEYNAVKKDAYISNFEVWRILHCLITVVFAFLFVNSLFSELLSVNRQFYFIALIYSIVTTCFFFILRKESIIAQFWIYLTISLLLLFSCFITQNKTDHPATTFIVMLMVTPMFMIDKPFFMGIVLAVASTIYLIWMHSVKSQFIWEVDLVNIIVFSISGFLIHIVSNSLRIREFVLSRKITIQKDTDDLTGLKNKGALTREINSFLADKSKEKGILFILDIDRFKVINDTYGHDVGDSVIRQFGAYLDRFFTNGEIAGRFGGDEFIFFIKDTDDADLACRTAQELLSGAAEYIELPDERLDFSASIGIAIYNGLEQNYSELFKKADRALYEVKSKRVEHYRIFQ